LDDQAFNNVGEKHLMELRNGLYETADHRYIR